MFCYTSLFTCFTLFFQWCDFAFISCLTFSHQTFQSPFQLLNLKDKSQGTLSFCNQSQVLWEKYKLLSNQDQKYQVSLHHYFSIIIFLFVFFFIFITRVTDSCINSYCISCTTNIFLFFQLYLLLMIDSTCVVDKVSSHWVRMGFLFFSVPIAYPYDNFSLMVCSIIVSFIFLSDLPMCLIKTSIFCFVSSYFPWL